MEICQGKKRLKKEISQDKNFYLDLLVVFILRTPNSKLLNRNTLDQLAAILDQLAAIILRDS